MTPAAPSKIARGDDILLVALLAVWVGAFPDACDDTEPDGFAVLLPDEIAVVVAAEEEDAAAEPPP